MIFAGVITGILLTAFAAFLMAVFYKYGKQVGYEKGLEISKIIFHDFKINGLEYIPKKDLLEFINSYVDDEGNELPDWYPLLIVKPESFDAEFEAHFKGE